MSSSIHEDYLLRQVRAAAQALARILGLRISGRLAEAQVELESAYGLLLGPQNQLLRRVDATTAAHMLSAPERILSYAQLVQEEAAQTQDTGQVLPLRQRALELGLEAARRAPEDEQITRFVEELAHHVDAQGLGHEHRSALEKIIRGRHGR